MHLTTERYRIKHQIKPKAKPTKPTKKCSVPKCVSQVGLRNTSGFCPACRSWWARMRYYSPTQLTVYIYRRERIMSRLPLLGGK